MDNLPCVFQLLEISLIVNCKGDEHELTKLGIMIHPLNISKDLIYFNLSCVLNMINNNYLYVTQLLK